jgi:L,D-transpeptidase YcbB
MVQVHRPTRPSAAALTLFISTQVFGANDQVPPQSHALATQSVADNGSSLAPLGSPDEVNSEKAKESEQAKPIRSSEDLAVADQLRGLVETKLQRYVPRQQDGAGIAALYRKRDFAPIWISAGKPLPRARQAANFLQGVAADGLDPNDYPTPPFAKADPAQLAAQELALTDSIARFVRHASTGRVAFTRVSGSIYFDLKVPDLEQALERIAGSDDVAATLDSFNPQQPEYKVLKAALASARRSLDFEADVSAAAAQRTDASHKDRGAQKSKADRIDTISANMERWRWLPRNFGAAYAIVNIPDYTLKVVNLGKTVWSTRIVVGKPGKYATPLLVETMKYITFNPTWNVPPSIIRNEYLPALEKDPGALARIGLKVGRNDDGSIRIYQPPGERNALGRIRFNFPNRFLVYQHDTPNKNLFEKTARAYSHGCMRVENPDQYAEVLLSLSQPEDGYNVKRIRMLYGGDERSINLNNPIPVYITYQTAFLDDAGQLQVRPDIYSLDHDITSLLHGDSEVADIPIHRDYGSSGKPVMAHIPSRRRNDFAERRYDWESGGEQSYFQRRQSYFGQVDRYRFW